MNDQAIRFRIGIFVLAGLILLGLLVFMFGGFPKYFKNASHYTVAFDNAPGIGPGTPVRKSGIKIGEVDEVKLDNETGKVKVGIFIDREYSLRKSDKATIRLGLLGGDAAISFEPAEDQRVAERGFWPPGATIPGYVQSDPLALVERTLPQAQEALIEIKKAFSRLEKAGPGLEDAFRDLREMAKMARDAVPELRKTNDDIRDLIKVTKQTVPDFKRTSDEIAITSQSIDKLARRLDMFVQMNEDKVGKTLDGVQVVLKRVNDTFNDENQKNLSATLKNLSGGTEKLDSLTKSADEFLRDGKIAMKTLAEAMSKTDDIINNLTKATKPLGERGPSIMKNLDEGTAELTRTMADLREILQVVGRSEGTVQKLLTDPALYNNLNDSAAMVTKILPRLDRVLRDAEIFADKIARHPEALGIGGVIRPSNGLKENPTVIPYYRVPQGSIIGP